MKTVILLLVAVVTAYVSLRVYGGFRWSARTEAIRARLDAGSRPMEERVVDLAQVEALPGPVRRYFETVLRQGQAVVQRVRVRHEGTFNMSETEPSWKPFTSDQVVVTRSPGFDWNGRIVILPGLPVHVHDAYVAGEGILHAALFGLFTVTEMRGTRAVAEGELMRFFAEAAWYPTLLLPSQGVVWEPVDERSARATLTADGVSLTMTFGFHASGEIHTVRAEARGRTTGEEIIPTPWEGRFWNYEERGGMRIPLDGEVAWLLPEGSRPYWRGRIVEIEYDFAD